MARGRKINSNGERSKQLLLEKAMELFSMKGYHETKISDIVKAANVTQPTFYLYFESKDSLYNDLNRRFLYEFDQIMNKSSEQVEKGFAGFIRALEQKNNAALHLHNRKSNFNENRLFRIDPVTFS